MSENFQLVKCLRPNMLKISSNFFRTFLGGIIWRRTLRCVAFVNIDMNAVGNWAERNNIAYSSYQELSGHPMVLGMVQDHVENVNKSVAEDEMLKAVKFTASLFCIRNWTQMMAK